MLVQQDKDHGSAADPSGQGNSSSVLLHSSKLRNKLEKLAQWRIDPSLIDFSENAREFRGGYATVSEAFLASSSSAEGAENGAEQTTDRHPDSDARNLQSQSDTQENKDDQGGENERSSGDITDGENDREKDEQDSGRQTSKPKVGDNLAYQLRVQQIVAVKKLKIERDTDLERVLGLALRESEFLVKLSHPNIVKLEGFVEDLSAQKVWLIFPWEEYGNLRDFLASGEWEVPERISLIDDVTLGLDYLHSQEPPIYHGDLKSLNILVSSECRALITDFGSARHLGSDHVGKQAKGTDQKPQPTTDPNAGEEPITLEAIFSATASTLTLTGSGYTLRWAAPELLQDDKPCLGSDIWALGWIAYEVMTNTIPFHDVKKNAMVINCVIQGQLPSVTEDARMSLIRALCSLMVRCWSMNPEKRPTAEECRKLISWMPMIIPAPSQAIDEDASQLRQANLLNTLGDMYTKQADYPRALSSFTEALDIYTTRNDNKGQARTLRNLGDVHRFRNEYTEAIKLYLEALQINAGLGDESERASILFGLASMHQSRQEYGEAIKLYSECLQIYTSTGRKRDRATALWGLAEVHRDQAEYSKAINLYSEALQVYTDVGDLRERALTLWCLAELHRFQFEYSEAINLYSDALQAFTDTGDHSERARTLWSLAEVHRSQHKYSEASKLHSEALQIRNEIGDRRGRGTSLWGLAKVHQAVQEYDEAIKLYSEAMQMFTAVDDKPWRVETIMSLAETIRKQGRSGEAISLYTEASEAFKQMGDEERASDALENAADIRKTLQEATTDSTETAKVGEDSSVPTSS
ncbi:hypothetical protein M407DRAFT_24875 [Tulasnella calospora MUT 4182]|uniref:Protein kinase domain-containing protein n=1 Tax=Tulasnella calospora MUT 4182 TaxID=1051891 RepID=A0A0C3QH77_9AGAM|nr:hypothetical protein M407DRAFT_24875 [Tulasnella calospora MUT 4182]